MFKSYSFFVHFCLKCEVWIMGQYFGMWKSNCSSTDLKKQLFLQLHCLFIYTKNQLTFWDVCISCLCWCFPGGARTYLPMQETQETQVRSLDWEDSLKKEIATHSSILAWRIPWKEEPGVLQFMRSQRVRHYRSNSTNTHLGICFG